MTPQNEFDQLREEAYRQRLQTESLRRQVYAQADPASSPVFVQLQSAEKTLAEIENKRQQAEALSPQNASARSLVLDSRRTQTLLGPETTGLDVQINLRMAQVPTAICHLLDPAQHPLVSCSVREAKNTKRRLRIVSFIDGYSAKAIDTVELDPLGKHEFDQLPTLFPDRIRRLTELTRATLNVLVEDLDGKVELQQTKPIWLLARTTAPLAVKDTKNGTWQDLTPYLGAFVTPNAPAVMGFLREAARFQPQGQFVGYQGDKNSTEIVKAQVKAIFDALKERAQIAYVNSVIEFSPEEETVTVNQRVRLPQESLKERQANCIDGTVLFASLLEGISLNPSIVVMPGHAFVGWETWEKSDKWNFLETTMIGSDSFEQACGSAESLAAFYASLPDVAGGAPRFRKWPLRTLRTTNRIFPMA
jgi:hypothetical protein